MSCRLTELCDSDKQKVAKLLHKVVDLSGRLKAADAECREAKRKFSAKELALRRRSKKAAAENSRLQAELTENMKLLHIYKDQLRAGGTETESAEPSAWPHGSQHLRPAQRTDAPLRRAFEDRQWDVQAKKARAAITAIEAECLQQLFQLRDHLSDVQSERSSRRMEDDNLAKDCLLEGYFGAAQPSVGNCGTCIRLQLGSRPPHRTRSHHRLEKWSAEDADELLSIIYETENEAA